MPGKLFLVLLYNFAVFFVAILHNYFAMKKSFHKLNGSVLYLFGGTKISCNSNVYACYHFWIGFPSRCSIRPDFKHTSAFMGAYICARSCMRVRVYAFKCTCLCAMDILGIMCKKIYEFISTCNGCARNTHAGEICFTSPMLSVTQASHWETSLYGRQWPFGHDRLSNKT